MRQFALSALEMAINQYLQLDPTVARLLEPLVNKTIAVTVKPLPCPFLFYCSDNYIQVSAESDAEPHAHLTGSLIAFLCMAKSKQPLKTLSSGQIVITGDTEAAQAFGDLWTRLDIDWEEHLSHIVGDSVAHTLGSAINSLFSWGRETAETTQQNITEYLQEELRHVPPREEVEDFMNDIDALRQDYDRLEARFNRLQKKEDLH